MIITNLILMAPSGEGGSGMSMLFIAAIFIVMYLFMFRPQMKKAKDQKKFLQQLDKGNKIVTIGGVHGKIIKVDETTVLVEVDPNTRLTIEKSAISLEPTKALSKEGNR